MLHGRPAALAAAAQRTPAVALVARRALACWTAAALSCGLGPGRASAVYKDGEQIVPVFGSGGVLDAFSKPSEKTLRENYAANPVDLRGVTLPSAFRGARDVAIIFHGAGGPDRETSDMAAAFARADAAAGLQRAVAVFNWMEFFTSNTDRLSFVSRDLGAALGTELAGAAPGLRSLHIVGTSAGSFAADAMASAYVRAREGRQRAGVRLSLADPFTARDGDDFNTGRGAQYFGRDADFAEHILNTDDPVPNTSDPLPLCYCLDVTGAAERAQFPPPPPSGRGALADLVLRALVNHNWPLGWLARHYEPALGADGHVVHPSHAQLPRGAVVRIA